MATNTSHSPLQAVNGHVDNTSPARRAAVKYAVEAIGTFSGGAFNPAVTIGAAVMHMFAWPTLWVYLVAEVVAGAAAGIAFLALNPDDK